MIDVFSGMLNAPIKGDVTKSIGKEQRV